MPPDPPDDESAGDGVGQGCSVGRGHRHGSSDLASASLEPLPLFPLGSVLVPGAPLALRVFEVRYLDLIRECGRNGSGFGVCLILDGHEVGAPAVPALVGTEARIEDFDTTSDGLLALRVRGHRRFRLRSTQVRDNGLIVGSVAWCAPDPDDELRPEHAVLGLVVRKLLDEFGGEHAQAPTRLLDDAAWIGWRLGELLPLSAGQRLRLLDLDDPHARLDLLIQFMS